MVGWIRTGGGCVRVGATVMGVEQKRGEGKQRFKKGGQAGSRGGCLKNGAWKPLTNYAHTLANRLRHPYKFLLTPPVICSQQLSVLHWTYYLLILKIYFTEFHNAFSKAKHLKKSHICWLDSIRLSSSHKTQNTDRNGIDKQTKQTKKDNIGKV